MAVCGLMPTALVIGARNLGFAIIERLLSDGWSVTGGARSADTLARVGELGARALEVDVTDQASVLAALQVEYAAADPGAPRRPPCSGRQRRCATLGQVWRLGRLPPASLRR